MSLSSGRKSPLTADPNTSSRLTWWRRQRFLICGLRLATSGIIFRRWDFSRVLADQRAHLLGLRLCL